MTTHIQHQTANQFIDTVVNGASNHQDTAALKKLEKNEEEKKELRKKLKSHHKMLSDKADDCYEKDNKELGRKYREMAKKLSDDMDDEGAELSLANYEIDEAALSNPAIEQMKLMKKDLEAQLAEIKNITAKLGSNQTATISETERVEKLKTLFVQAKELLGV